MPADQDAANHAFLSASITKVTEAAVNYINPAITTHDTKNNDALVFVVCSALFIGKEVYDTVKPNPTGFSINDLVYDYFGYGLIRWKWEF